LTFLIACIAAITVVVSALDDATKASGAKKVHVKDEYWNQFRGPKGEGKIHAENLPVEFSETKNIRWRTPIHGKGWSSPVVWGNQIWLTTGHADGSKLFAICVDRESGKIIHDIKVFDVEHPQLEWPNQNSHASPTPVIEDGRIYVHYGTYGTACLDTKSGKNLWERRDLNCDHRVRAGSSPIIDGDSLFLVFDGVDVQFITALDKHTGKTLWLRNREGLSDLGAMMKAEGYSDADIEETKKLKENDNRKSYATPTLIEVQGRRQLISPAAEFTFSYDPKTGDELWRLRHQGMGFNVTCRPIFENGLVYLTTGIAKRLLAVRPSGTGDITDTHVAGSDRRRSPTISSPLIIDDLLFMVTDAGARVSCLEAQTGNEVWSERLGSGRQTHWASPIYADGKIYFLSKEGTVAVIAAEREYKLLAENKFRASFIASPAVAGNDLILRSTTHLYCFAEGYEMAPQTEITGKTKPEPSEPARSDLYALGAMLKEAVASGKLTEDEATQKFQAAAAKSKSNKSKPTSGLSLNVTGYYMGSAMRDDGEFEASFLIEIPNLDKDQWPSIIFSGEPFRDDLAHLTLYQPVTLNLAKRLTKKGKGDQ
jgi:outer membrane protein assembly factor BamB